jgi:hypothetical protein
VFHRLKAASEILPLHGHDPEFGLIRDFGQSIEDRHLHFVFLLVWLPEGGPMRPSRLVVCSDAVEVLDSEADLRLSHLHCDELIERAARIISGMIARVRGDDTGHELLRAQAALRQAAFKAIGRYRRRG